MEFGPKAVLTWYKKRPFWLQALLFLFILIPIALAVMWYVFRTLPASIGASKNDTVQVAADGINEHFAGHADAAAKQDEKITAWIEAERTIQATLEEEREKAMDANRSRHEEIENADSIADIRAALNNQRE